MANAMLTQDYQTSHPDLVTLDHQQDSKINSTKRFMNVSEIDEIDIKPNSMPLPSRTKSVDFAILPPTSKRTRTSILNSSKWTAKQVVDGTYKSNLIGNCAFPISVIVEMHV